MNKLSFSPKGQNLLKEAVVFLTISTFIFVVGFTYSLTQYRIVFFLAGFLTLLGAVWLLTGQKVATPLKPYILIWLVAYFTSVILSIDPRRSLTQMFLMLIGVFLFLLTYDLVSRGWDIDLFLKAFLYVGVIIIIFSLYEAGSWYLRWISNNPGQWFPDITYRLSTGNLMPPFMILTFHSGIPLFIKAKKKTTRFGLAIIMFLAMMVLYLTSSRGGWLGMFFGLMIWGLYFFFTARIFIKTSLQKLMANKFIFIASILIISVVILIGGFLLYKQAVHPTHGSVFSARDGYWGPAIDTFLEHPLFGQGQFTFASSFLRENSTPPMGFHQHAHSLYLNLLGEMGIAGLIAALLFMIAYFRKFRAVFAKSQNKLAMLGIFAFIVSCAVHNVFDAYHTKPAMLWPLAILAGAAIAQPSSQIKTQSKTRPWGVLTLIGFAWLGVWTITPYYQAVDLANRNQWQQAYDTFQQAVQRDPGNALAHQQLALSAAVLVEEGNQNLLSVAIQELETTIQLEPSWALNHANLAVLYFENNEIDEAIRFAQKAVELAPAVPLFTLNSGFLLEQIGENDQAQLAYIKTLDLKPDWSTASFWKETSLRMDTLNRWIKVQPTQTQVNLSEAQEILNANKHFSWAYNGLAKAQLDSGELESARRSLENAGLAYVNTSVDLLETQWIWAEYYAQTGEFKKAIEIGNITIVRFSQYGVYGPGTFGLLQYAPNLFRMSAMALEIVPQMVEMPLSNVWLKRENGLQEWQ
ncbi:MAG: O-antigen ligase family protein [Anaerolineaceae bacterium]|nr:O-antigen ligase family protein [Anaerolineaceae bacterium]